MQRYREILASDSMRASREMLLNNDKTAISCSSGESFPAGDNVLEGMMCFRTDSGALYQQSENYTEDKDGWGQITKLVSGKVAAVRAEQDASGNVINETYATAASPEFTGDMTVAGTITADGNIEAKGTLKASKVYNAVYNDYAEFFPRGEKTEPGDIIALDTTAGEERYIKADENSKCVVGVHSDTYGHILGGEEGLSEYDLLESYIPVGLSGRVNVKVCGDISLGDGVVPSKVPGVGCRYDDKKHSLRQIVGYVVAFVEEGKVKIKV